MNLNPPPPPRLHHLGGSAGVNVEGYLNEVLSCVTNLQQGDEAAINICYQHHGYSHTHADMHKTHPHHSTPTPQHTQEEYMVKLQVKHTQE